MTFELRDKIMVLVNDNITAYGIAQEFIKDDEHKFVVYQRCFHNASNINASSQDDLVLAKASQAKDRAGQLWKEYETAA